MEARLRLGFTRNLFMIADFVNGFAHTILRILPYMAVMGVVFAGLSAFTPCNPGAPWWKKRGLVTDLTYLFIVPVFTRYGRIGFTVLVTVYLLGINSAQGLVDFFEHGHGPIARLPFWLQFAIYILSTEFLLLLVAPSLPCDETVEVPRRASLLRGMSNGSRRRGFIRSICCSARCWSTSRR